MAKIPQEYLLNNFLERDLQDFLKPFILSQHLSLQSRFSIRDNFITTNGYIYKMAGFMAVACTTAANYFSVDILFKELTMIAGFLTVAAYINCFFCSVASITLYADNILNAKYNVQFILKIQAVLRALRFCKNTMHGMVLYNRITVGVFTIYMFMVQISMFYVDNFNVAAILANVVVYFYDMTIIYAYAMLKLLRRSFEMWLEELKIRNMLLNVTNTHLRSVVSDWPEIEGAFLNLSQAFRLSKKIVSIPVSGDMATWGAIPCIVCSKFFFVILGLRWASIKLDGRRR